jgi:hypothetical protein
MLNIYFIYEQVLMIKVYGMTTFSVYKTWYIQIFQLFCQVNKTYNPTINVTSFSKEHMEDGSNEPKHGIEHWGASNKSL